MRRIGIVALLALLALLAACQHETPPTRVSLSTGAAVPFVAFVDGDGAWTRVDASGPGEYEYEVSSGRWGVAWVCDRAAVAVLLAIGEATDLVEPCLPEPTTAPMQGEVLGFAEQESGSVAVSTGGTSLPIGATRPGFEVDVPQADEFEVAIQVFDPDAEETRVLIDRGLQGAPTNASYDANDAVPLEVHEASVRGDVVGAVIGSRLVTRTGRFYWTGAGQARFDRILSMPEALLDDDDLQVVTASEPEIADGNGRWVESWRRIPGDEILFFPERPTPPAVELVAAASGGVHVRATLAAPGADAYHLIAFQQDLEPPFDRLPAQAVIATSGWLVDTDPLVLVFPPADELPGWPDTADLTPISVRWQFFVERARGGATSLLPGHEPRLPDGDGAVRQYAGTAGNVE